MVLALPAVAIGLVGLMFAFALFPLTRPIANAIAGKIPLIGNVLQGALDAFIWATYADFFSQIGGWISGLGEVFSIPINVVHALVDQLGAVTDGTLTALYSVRWVTIPLLVTQLNGVSYLLYGKALANAATLQQQVTGLVWAVQSQTYAQVRVWVGQLTADIAAAQQTAETYAVQLQQQVVGLVWDRFYAAQAYASGLTAGALSQLSTVESQIVGLVWNRFYQAEADAKALVDAGVSQLEQEIAGVRAQDAARLAAEAATLGGALTLVQTAVQAIEDSPCMQQCSTLGPLGQDLAQLADLAFIAALIDWAGAGVKDPQAAADDAIGVLQPIAGPAADLVKSLTGT